jgi:hypothetical protein
VDHATKAWSQPTFYNRARMTAGFKQGPHMGVVLKEAFEAQLEGTFEDEAGAIEWLRLKMEAAAVADR